LPSAGPKNRSNLGEESLVEIPLPKTNGLEKTPAKKRKKEKKTQKTNGGEREK